MTFTVLFHRGFGGVFWGFSGSKWGLFRVVLGLNWCSFVLRFGRGLGDVWSSFEADFMVDFGDCCVGVLGVWGGLFSAVFRWVR